MPLPIRSSRHFPAHCFVTHNADLYQDQGTVWSISHPGWRLSEHMPMRQRETLSLNITLSKEQSLLGAEARVWCRNEVAMAPLYCTEESGTSSE
jgi:hypothetical protein